MAKRGRRLPSVMKNRFATLPSANIRRSSFDRSHSLKTTMNLDYLYPVFLDEVLPGDTFTLSTAHLCRLTTLTQPIMDNVKFEVQWFFCSNRLLWRGQLDQKGRETGGWEDFITGGDEPVAWTGPENPADKLYLPQTFSPAGGYGEQTIYDYFGLPTKVANYRHTVLPLRAYNLIWNEYYRDQNLQESLPVWTGDADPKVDPDTGEPSTDERAIPYVYTLKKRNKRWDYFTSCLPGLQKHYASVGIGIAGGDNGRLPVHGLALTQYGGTPDTTPPFQVNSSSVGAFSTVNLNGNSATPVPYYYGIDGDLISPTTTASATQGKWPLGSTIAYYDGVPVKHVRPGYGDAYTSAPFNQENWPIYVDLGSASSVTINALRNAITLQHWYERNARYGTRYIEQIQGHFGVHAGDYRLARPIFLGSIKNFISINPTVQSSSTDKTSPQGNLAAYALSTDSKKVFTKSFVEHGWILGLASCYADLTYQQGLDRMWSRFSRYDFYWDSFCHLGEQPVYNREIYTQSDDVKDSATGVAVNDLPFGYQERYAEYRYKPSKITGLFRSNAAQSLHSWHLSQNFGKLPTLNSTFIEYDTPIDRALAVPNQPDLLCDFYFNLRCVRPMPVYSVPGLRRI